MNTLEILVVDKANSIHLIDNSGSIKWSKSINGEILGDVKQIDLDKAIIEKNKFSKKTDFKMYLATQFFFEAESLKRWEAHLNKLNNL